MGISCSLITLVFIGKSFVAEGLPSTYLRFVLITLKQSDICLVVITGSKIHHHYAHA